MRTTKALTRRTRTRTEGHGHNFNAQTISMVSVNSRITSVTSVLVLLI